MECTGDRLVVLGGELPSKTPLPCIRTRSTVASTHDPPTKHAGDTDPNLHGREAEGRFRLPAQVPAEFNVRDPRGTVQQ